MREINEELLESNKQQSNEIETLGKQFEKLHQKHEKQTLKLQQEHQRAS